METVLYLTIGLIIGTIIGWLTAKTKVARISQSEKESANKQYNDLDKDFAATKATLFAQIESLNNDLSKNQSLLSTANDLIKEKSNELLMSRNDLATITANLKAAEQTIVDKNKELEILKDEIKVLRNDLTLSNQDLATAKANSSALNEKFDTQKKEIEDLSKKFNTEFENIANKILETKSEKFTEINKTNLKTILEPLGKNIDEFKKQVDEVYKNESKERFSLGEKVKELTQLNQVISEETRNLTKALKGESKTQGRWGEMILESILEKSGLRKDEQYFIEHQLRDDSDVALRSDSEGKKMRPDVVIKYPDERNVIIDSKVSLNAFTRLLAATDIDDQKRELDAHVSAIKSHIITLSSKGYDDYDKTLDFVMMFVPSEPAYIAAMQGDPDLWNFAYDKRILLISPTNLITSLKLIVDLWKREYQNRNSQEIAERGAKLYDKFVGFIDNLKDVGSYIGKAQTRYDEAFKQLSTGNDNLVSQATKLKNLGLKTKKELPKTITPLLDSENGTEQLSGN